MAGNAQIAGLPFSMKAVTDYRIACEVFYSMLDLEATRPYISCIMLAGGASLLLMEKGDNTSTIALIAERITNTTRLTISGSYQI
ncbi:MAG: hypothetical protein GX625_14360 [Clostridiaceae bacterium]|nr:hypothetical protein [Clostridiaceae bacterium]